VHSPQADRQYGMQGGISMAAHLRVYPGSSEADESEFTQAAVHVRLGDLLPLIARAQRRNYLWLQDFLDDEVAITSDLYDVLRAFKYQRPSA
jgi:hypothetical protein